MIYQHPLAYLLGLEGMALMRAWAGDYDKDFVRRRLAEVRWLLEQDVLANHEGVEVARRDTATGYRQWSASYDEPRNSLFDADEPLVHEIVGALPTGTALDAACGTGRFAAHLVTLGHEVIGVDRSPEMVARARERVPLGRFRVGDLHDLPLPDDAVDLVVCGLALSHVRALEPVMAEFARVVRPGGHLVISDTHHELVLRGSVPKALGPTGEPGLVATYRHSPVAYLRAALPSGFEVRRCEEPTRRDDREIVTDSTAPEVTVGDWQDWPWSLLGVVPDAARAAWAIPPVIIWHFQRAGR